MKILDPRVLVLASAGSGKTYQLGNRILGLIALGVEAESIAALTFTRKAAGEFTDTVLSKAAEAVLDEHAAGRITKDLLRSGRMLTDINFCELLEFFVSALPRMVLGTMDGFFTKVVQAFPHEMGIHEGRMRLVEGAEWQLRQGEVLAELLSARSVPQTQAFLEAFRQSNMGREVLSVRRMLEKFINEWHRVMLHDAGDLVWGPDEFSCGVTADDWNRHRYSIVDALRLAEVTINHASQAKQWKSMLAAMAEHTTGSGRFKPAKLWDALMEEGEWQDGGRDVEISYYNKPMILPAVTWSMLCSAMQQMAMAEMARACQTTQAIRAMIEQFDVLCEQRLRRRGLLCFDDVKMMMGRWTRGEDQRLVREVMDFRLQSRHRHWLLDEFQDTSRADWMGLFPLIDEAATTEDGSLFIVGDRKQAIYGWRGGDVKLFDDVERRYGADLTREVMLESYRSCSEVLACINQVFGDRAVLNQLFPHAAIRWVWEDHISAKHEMRGHACVRVLDPKEDAREHDSRLDAMLADMQRIHAGENDRSIAVLVRTNDEMLEAADFLREQGYQVVEDGQRNTSEDHLIGVAIRHWLRWLADPGDQMAAGVLRLSPIIRWLENSFGNNPWQKCHDYAQQFGYAALINDVVTPQMHGASPFAQQRCMDAVDCMKIVDASGRASARYAEVTFSAYRVSHPPGSAQIQVMTIHKSKGLGFDVVFLPYISSDKIPHEGYFDVARGRNWICKSPPAWVRSMSAEMTAAMDAWVADQQYEAMCLLYVAFTRAKRGLYVYLKDQLKKDPERPSFANWIRAALGLHDEVLYEVGQQEVLADTPASPHLETAPALPMPLRPATIIPSATRASSSIVYDQDAAEAGTMWHKRWAQFSWLDENHGAQLPPMRDGKKPSQIFSKIFTKNQRHISLYREVPMDGTLDGKKVYGILDRLHLHKNAEQQVTMIELIELKTDDAQSPELLAMRYVHQMNAYIQLIAKKWPAVPISAYIATNQGAVIPIE